MEPPLLIEIIKLVDIKHKEKGTIMRRDIEMYQDIINLSHFESHKRKRMSLEERAAQFAPFAALTGHNETIKEVARLTTQKREIDEMEKELLSIKLQIIESRLNEELPCKFTYFIKDRKKTGGEYHEIWGTIKEIDMVNKVIVLKDKTKIQMDDITDIKCSAFSILDNIE